MAQAFQGKTTSPYWLQLEEFPDAGLEWGRFGELLDPGGSEVGGHPARGPASRPEGGQ
jgi:hypothetical protein